MPKEKSFSLKSSLKSLKDLKNFKIGKFLPFILFDFLLPFVFLYLVFFLIKNINLQRSELRRNKQIESELTKKRDFLQEQSISFPAYLDYLLLALPENNVSLLALFQIRNLASQNLIFVKNIGVSSPSSDKNIVKVQIKFDAEGDNFESLLDYVVDLQRALPLFEINRFSLSRKESQFQASFLLSTFFSPYPETIPTLEGGEKEFSEKERSLLSKIQTYKKPEVRIILPTGGVERTNPFRSE